LPALSLVALEPLKTHFGKWRCRAPADPAHAIDPAQTQVILPDQYQWKPALPNAPAQSVETVPVFGATDKPGRTWC
jgi:hypothetical protein